MEEDVSKKAFNYAIRLLSRRDYSKYKLLQKLKEKGFPKEIHEEIINKLIELKYLNEDEYKLARIKGFIRKGYSSDAIVFKLKQENCSASSTEILSIFQELETNDDLIATDIVQKKYRLEKDFSTNTKKLKNKVIRYALQRGHSFSKITNILEQINN